MRGPMTGLIGVIAALLLSWLGAHRPVEDRLAIIVLTIYAGLGLLALGPEWLTLIRRRMGRHD